MAVTTHAVGLWVDGQESGAASGETFASTDPSTGEPLARVALGDAADVDRAVAGARAAFGDWRATTPRERGRLLAALAPALLAAADALVEAGAPRRRPPGAGGARGPRAAA